MAHLRRNDKDPPDGRERAHRLSRFFVCAPDIFEKIPLFFFVILFITYYSYVVIITSAIGFFLFRTHVSSDVCLQKTMGSELGNALFFCTLEGVRCNNNMKHEYLDTVCPR